MAWSRQHKAFARDAALVWVTAGLWLVWWAWRENRALAKWFPERRTLDNLAFFLVGGTVATVARALLVGRIPDTVVLALTIGGVLLFAAGLYLLSFHAQRASHILPVGGTDPPWLFSASVALAFIGVELGNTTNATAVRIPVLVFLLVLPYLFYRTHADLWRIRRHVEGDREETPARRIRGRAPVRPTS